MEKKNHAVAYVDGSYSNNIAGYGVVFFYEDAKEPEYFRIKSGNPRPFNDRDESVKSYI